MIRELLKMLEDAEQGKIGRNAVLKALDQLEDQVDAIIMQMAPERITDERFEAAVSSLRKIAKGFYKLSKLIVAERYSEAIRMLTVLRERLRDCFRTMTFIKAGAPTPLVLQFSPTTSLYPPEVLLQRSPGATQLYNLLARRGEADIAEVAKELGLSADALNEAINTLVGLGFVKLLLTPDGRWKLRVVR
jgi:biotin operon repressor